MTKEKLEKTIHDLREHKSNRVVEVKTKEHARRGLIKEIDEVGKLLLVWFPDIAKDVKFINLHGLNATVVCCTYEAKDIISITAI